MATNNNTEGVHLRRVTPKRWNETSRYHVLREGRTIGRVSASLTSSTRPLWNAATNVRLLGSFDTRRDAVAAVVRGDR
jgi:hypothetical protein